MACSIGARVRNTIRASKEMRHPVDYRFFQSIKGSSVEASLAGAAT
jgi:hypothetical protein